MVLLGARSRVDAAAASYRVMMLDAEPCKRYYVNAQYQNRQQPNFDAGHRLRLKDIAGCTASSAEK